MKLVKDDLRSYFKQKFRTRREEIEAEAKSVIEPIVDPIIESIVGANVRLAESLGDKLNDVLNNVIEEHALGWDVTQVVQKINSHIIGLSNTIKNKKKSQLIYAIKNNTDNYKSGNEKLDEAVKELQTQCKPIYSKLVELNKLENEIENVIAVSSNAKKAYDFLLEQNVDMTDLKIDGVYLPAISKLTANVCVLNKTC